ncbi:MAG: tRNA (N6-isopentenyl adenosine(37)-C2)-methylthiotransferase MiaB [Actinomycetota bacterium]
MEGRRYLLRTFGCQMNEHDSERIAGLLESDGFTRTQEAADAQVIVFNTCAVRENADNRLYGNLGHLLELKRRNPRLRIVVAGCLAQKDQGLVRERAPWVDVVVGTHALAELRDLLRRAETQGPQMDVREFTDVFPSALPSRREASHHAWVAIATGCDNACSFCIVPLVRGPQRSRPFDEVLGEVRRLARQGVVEVTLLGQNVNTYGRDLTVAGSGKRSHFAALLCAVDSIESIRRIRFASPHPHDFTPDVIDAMAECPSVCEHIHFPLQSGSDRVLGAMGRSYRRDRYLDWLRQIREAIPGMAVSTDVMVGFPGETEEDFEDTLDLVREARFDQAYTFQYSPRAGTRAALMPDQVPKEIVQARFDRLVVLQESISLEKMRELGGQTVEVLVEGMGRKGAVQGRTRTNKVVHLPGEFAPGTFLDARVVSSHPHHLTAELVGVTAGPPAEQAVDAVG